MVNIEKRVLIVEDLVEQQKIFYEIVRRLGYSTQFASSLDQAWQLIEKFTFHVALVDLSLVDIDPSNRDGFKVLERLNAKNEFTKSLVLTAYGTASDANDAFNKYSVEAFLEKGKMQIEEISQKIRECAEKAEFEKMRPSHLLQADSLINHMGLSKILVNSEDSDVLTQEISRISKRLLIPFLPLLPKSKTKILGKAQIAKIQFWSRFFGGAIEIWIGNLFEVKSAIQDLGEKQMRETGLGTMLFEMFDERDFPQYGGCVFSVDAIPFEDFQEI